MEIVGPYDAHEKYLRVRLIFDTVYLSLVSNCSKLSTNNTNFDILGPNYHANAILCKYFL